MKAVLGNLQAERELSVLKEIKKSQPVLYYIVATDYPNDVAGYILDDLGSYGLIRYDKDELTYSLTKKGEKFLKDGAK